MALNPTQKKKVRAAMTDYCLRAEAHQTQWMYTQMRPFRGYMVPPEARHANDCSGYVSLVFNWAMHKAGVYLADPLGEHYTGWGYTGTEVQWLKQHGQRAPDGKWLVGDLVVYGHSLEGSHTTVCRQAGSDTTAVWSSNGSVSSPNPVKLYYHPDPVLGVWRHPALL